MAARSRGLGITSKDMEASRLVFVYVKDSKPRRKVAIPVPDSYTWEQFLTQVKIKLKLTGIAEIYFSSTGVKVTNVNELQDIDELCVVEGPAESAVGNGTAPPAATQRSAADLARATSTSPVEGVLSPSSTLQQRQQSLPPERHKVVVSTDGMMPSTSASYATDEGDYKYARRAHPLKRTLQRLFPNLFAPGLPITNRDAQLDGSADGSSTNSKASRRRRSRRSPYNLRNLLLVLFTMSCVATMLYLFIWVSSSPAMAGMSQAEPQGGSSTAASRAAAAAAGAGTAAGGTVPAAAATNTVAPVKQPTIAAGDVVGGGPAARVAGSLAGTVQSVAGAAEAAGRAAGAI